MGSDFDEIERKIKRRIKSEQDAGERSYQQLLDQREKLKRFERVISLLNPVAIIFVGSVIIFSAFKKGFFEINISTPSTAIPSWPFVIIGVVVAAGAMLFYLRDSGPATSLSKLKDKVEDLEILLKAQPAFVKKELGQFFVSDETKNEIIAGIKDEIHKSAVDSTLNTLAAENIEAKKKIRFLEKVQSEHFDTMTRLQTAIRNLQTRANLNLVFGIILTGVGVAILWQTLSVPLHGDSAWDFARAYFPRLSLVLIVELFSYFFLNLYKGNINETRYYHNELTNISSRRISLMCALESGNQDAITSVIAEFSKTERNNVLKKGQTTVEIEKNRIQSDSNKNLTSIIERLLQSAIPSKKD
ncbi:hypothetical protein BLA18110_03410 [Burkholderia lata]|uniref:hypothetical protein n=1 Tax=Burkholderia lata (strain ATCC 17760 / DSM 23089 / LMG 22485 / NCIMB 9086 / R18194 / 383) TaxID=482957 RepID=UPI00145433E0|nr:hypothetical protein [Burkholderia lata]VWC91520.1 hypothetical protein BLA18110_03410 [Burkholderia lata]